MFVTIHCYAKDSPKIYGNGWLIIRIIFWTSSIICDTFYVGLYDVSGVDFTPIFTQLIVIISTVFITSLFLLVVATVGSNSGPSKYCTSMQSTRPSVGMTFSTNVKIEAITFNQWNDTW